MLKNFETAVSQLIDGVDWKKQKFDGFRNHHFVAQTAVIMSPDNINYVSEEFFDNKDFMLPCIKSSPNLVKYLSDRLKDDAELQLIALEGSQSKELFKDNAGPILQRLTKGKDNLLEVLKVIRKHKLVELVKEEDLKGEGRPKVHRKIGEFSFSL